MPSTGRLRLKRFFELARGRRAKRQLAGQRQATRRRHDHCLDAIADPDLESAIGVPELIQFDCRLALPPTLTNATSAPMATMVPSIVWPFSKRLVLSDTSNIAAKSSSTPGSVFGSVTTGLHPVSVQAEGDDGKNQEQPGNIYVVDDHNPVPRDVQRVVDRMSDRDWQSLTLQLGRYALQKSRRFYWRTGSSGELPDGEVTESLVSKAVLLWMTGRRRWNRSESGDLQGFLQGVIDSLLSHSANGHDNRGLPSTEDEALHPVVRATQEVELLQRERAAEAEQILTDIVAHARQDSVVIEIIDAMRNGAATRRAIVSATGRSADAIDNGLKRLRRLAANVVHITHEQCGVDVHEHPKAREPRQRRRPPIDPRTRRGGRAHRRTVTRGTRRRWYRCRPVRARSSQAGAAGADSAKTRVGVMGSRAELRAGGHGHQRGVVRRALPTESPRGRRGAAPGHTGPAHQSPAPGTRERRPERRSLALVVAQQVDPAFAAETSLQLARWEVSTQAQARANRNAAYANRILTGLQKLELSRDPGDRKIAIWNDLLPVLLEARKNRDDFFDVAIAYQRVLPLLRVSNPEVFLDSYWGELWILNILLDSKIVPVVDAARLQAPSPAVVQAIFERNASTLPDRDRKAFQEAVSVYQNTLKGLR